MILDQITLHNFGVYLGKQTIELTPPSTEKPVVLIGGLNGGGKTTLLDALHLSFFGKLSNCSNRGKLSYENFLLESIHRSVDPHDGASISINFHHRSNGRENHYSIKRFWAKNGKGVRENFEVIKNDVFDQTLTDTWEENVERFIPINIASLFFFDGEKIKNLADSNESSKLISTGIHSLLGLDIINQLMTDLIVLEKRKQTSIKSTKEQKRIKLQYDEMERLKQTRSDLRQHRGAAANNYDRIQRKLEELDSRFKLEGGDLFEKRIYLEAERSSKEKEILNVEEILIDIAGESTPLILVKNLLSEIQKQDNREQQAIRTESLKDFIYERDQNLLKNIKKLNPPIEIINAVETFFSDEQKKANNNKGIKQYLFLDVKTREELTFLITDVLDKCKERIIILLSSFEKLKSELIEFDRKIAMIPDGDAIADLIRQRETIRSEYNQARAYLEAVDSDIIRISNEINIHESKLNAEIEKEANEEFEKEDVQRVIKHSKLVRETITDFRVAVIKKHVDKIQGLILDSFEQLLRKKTLISNLKIDLKDFQLILYDKTGQVLSPDRLSAGERQMLAVSILWGLASASGRPLPTIIDTPLGRLDSSHRRHLVERYFPHASNQVLLLSTDEEITQKYYQMIKQWVGHSYLLEFDDSNDSTTIKKGYFWE